MFGKIFEQIYDSSIAEDYTTRLVFQDFIVLADINGVVDRTPEAISRRTNVPLEVVKKAILTLESPDPTSRSPEEHGARIRRLDEHRDWGWEIINYKHYREIASDEQRRENTKLRTRKWRGGKNKGQCDAPVTHGDAGDAMQRKKQMQRKKEKESTEGDFSKLPPDLINDVSQKAWEEWQRHRCEIKKKLTPMSAKAQIKDLREWGQEKWLAAIKKSISAGWTGIFEPKKEFGQPDLINTGKGKPATDVRGNTIYPGHPEYPYAT